MQQFLYTINQPRNKHLPNNRYSTDIFTYRSYRGYLQHQSKTSPILIILVVNASLQSELNVVIKISGRELHAKTDSA